jgi:FkbM family methyltransferase
LETFLKIAVNCLLKLPNVRIINGGIGILLDYIKDGVIKTRYNYRIHFRVTSPPATAVRKTVILGMWEKSNLNVISKLLKRGDYVIDAGAHEGYISLFISSIVGDSGRVFAIEPNPENREYIRQNIELNHATNIQVIDKAISDTPSKADFFYNDDGGAWGSLIRLPIFQTRKTMTVNVDTLDNLFYKSDYARRIKLCKLDIEGSETKALMGAKNILSEYKPIICFEVNLSFWAYQDVSIQVLFDFLKSNGYELFIAKDNKLHPYEWLYLRVIDIFAIHSSQKASLISTGIFAKTV